MIYVLVATIFLRLLVMQFIDLIDDEAYHWSWAQYLNISYFDHPGVVAWSIRPFTFLFGHSPFVIRLPGFLYVLGILFLVYKMSEELFDRTTARLAAVLMMFVPLWGFASLGTLPDVPLAFFWMLVFYCFWQIVRDDGKAWPAARGWITLSFAMGLGMNSKLTCCLIGIGMGIFLLSRKDLRKHLITPWPYLAVVITFLLMIPIFYWNSQNGWATFKYQFLRRHGEDFGADWSRWFQFLAYQSLLMSPGFYLFLVASFFYGLAQGFRKTGLRNAFFVSCLAAPSLALFYYQPLFSAYKPHWSGPAYLLLLPLASHLFLKGFGFFKAKSKWVAALVLIGMLPLNLLYLPLFTPIITQIGQRTEGFENKFDFSNEFYGWTEAAAEALRIAAKNGGEKTHLGAQRYELVSQLTWGATRAIETKRFSAVDSNLAFDPSRFSTKKPVVWSISNESNQFFYDQIQNREQILHHDFVIVNNDKYPRNPMDFARFASCEKTELKIYRKSFSSKAYTTPEPSTNSQTGIHARTFYLWLCKDLQSIDS